MASSNVTSCSLDKDNSFGPWSGPACRGGFDFTLVFQETLLNIVPTIIYFSLAAVQISIIWRASVKTRWSWKLAAKITVISIMSNLQLTLLVLRTTSRYKTRTTAASEALSLVAYLLLGLLTYLEHTRTYRPSTIISTYLIVTILFDIAFIRTLWLTPQPKGVPIVATIGFIFKIIVIVLESIQKRSELLRKEKMISPETTTGIIGRSFFWWLNRLLVLGSKQDLQLKQLFPLDEPLQARKVIQQLKAAAEKGRPSDYSLVWLLAWAYKWSILRGVIPRLCVVGLTFAQPFLINTAIRLSTLPHVRPFVNYGYGMIGAYFITYSGLGIMTGQYAQALNRTIVKIRGSLVSCIYEKTLRMPASAKESSEAITLMNADIERVTAGLNHIHDVWGSVVELAIAIYLLQIQIGAGTAIPVAFGILTTIVTVGFSAGVGKAQAAWLGAIQNRTAATAKTLAAMKSVKLSGLSAPSFKVLEHLRETEVTASLGLRKIILWTLVFATWTPALAPVFTFLYFVLHNDNGLGVSTAFTSLSIINILATPLGIVFQALPAVIGALGCIKRIQTYLEHPEIVVLNNEGDGNTSSGSNDEHGEKDALRIQDGNFGWDKHESPILSDINLNVPPKSFCVIYGPVGCGKSTLLKGILGESTTKEGTVHKSASTIAYCEQSAWLPNLSVRQSIIGYLPFDASFYETSLQACGLTTDLKLWPKGDKTIVGSTGSALSGGQKQRIALARAIYSRASLLILDDTFTGLDNETETKVFHELLGKQGILKRLDTTIILATANNRRVPYADHIVVLGADGKVREQGGFEALKGQNGHIAGLNLQSPDWDLGAHAITDLGSKEEEQKHVAEDPDQEAEGNGVENKARGTGDFAVYWYYFRNLGVVSLVMFVVVMISNAFATTFPTIWLKNWSEYNTRHPGGDTGKWLGVYAALGAISSATLVVGAYILFIRMVPKAAKNFHGILVNTVAGAPMSFFSETDTGVTLNRFTQDLQLIDMELPGTLLLTLIAILSCIGELVVMAVSAKYIAIAAPFLFVLAYYLQLFYLRTSRQLRFLELESRSALYTQFMETLGGLSTIRAFRWQKEMESQLYNALDETQKPFYLLLCVQRWLNLVIDMVIAVMAVVLIVLATQGGSIISPGFTGVALVSLLAFNGSVKLLITSWTQLETSIGSISRVKSFSKGTEQEDTGGLDDPPEDWPDRGEIVVDKITAAYGSNEVILNNVSIKIASGESIAICGRTGSGKSSLVLSLFRMLSLSTGSIQIDGIDISKLHPSSVRTRLVAVSQDAYSMTGSVRFNADPSSVHTDASILSALRAVTLESTIATKGGLDVSIESLSLSHGQHQLFCFARALLRKPTVLVLDEATSSVDAATEAIIQRLIRTEFAQCTILAVVHKLISVHDFDRVAVMEKGHLAEFDSPRVLLADASSAFSALYGAAHEAGSETPNSDEAVEIKSDRNTLLQSRYSSSSGDGDHEPQSDKKISGKKESEPTARLGDMELTSHWPKQTIMELP